MIKKLQEAINRLPESQYSTRSSLHGLLDSCTWFRSRASVQKERIMLRDLTGTLSSLYWTVEHTPVTCAYVVALLVALDQYAHNLDRALDNTLTDLETMEVQ